MYDSSHSHESEPRRQGGVRAPSLVEDYAAELAARYAELHADLALYRGKLDDLRQLDPLDFTGLGSLYHRHVEHLEALIEEFVDVA